MRVVIIDDDKKMAVLLKTALQMVFYEKAKYLAKGNQQLTECLDVIKFENQQKALRFLSQDSQFVDLIFLEVNTPGMSGFDFIDLCQNKFEDRFGKVIVVTDRADKQAVKQGLVAGALDYILKPFSPDDLKTHIFDVWQQRLDKKLSCDSDTA